MSSERVGGHTSRALDRHKARVVVQYARNLPLADMDAIVDRLEACVVPDPRIDALEAELERVGHISGYGPLRRRLEAIMRGDE